MFRYAMSLPSTTLRVGLHPTLAGVEFHFDGAGRSSGGVLAVDLERHLGRINEAERDLIATAALLVAAGLFVPSSIVVEWDSAAAVAPGFTELLGILYDVRAYCTKTAPLMPSVSIRPKGIASVAPVTCSADDHDLSAHSHILLFSGGIDSTYSLLRLLDEGKTPVALFLGANLDTVELEWEASCRIAEALGVRLLRWNLVTEGLPQRDADPTCWPHFGQFPYYNSIPHGRDILSAAVASVAASHSGIQHIAFGQEKESREKVTSYRGRRVLRHDVESVEGSALLETWLRRCTGSDLQLISPIETLTIEQIRLDMYDRHEDLLAMTQSCFWERLCGRCVKCISLYVLQRLTGMNVFHFDSNPFSDRWNRDLADAVSSDLPDNEIGYGAQIRNGLRRILADGKYTEDDYWIVQGSENLAPSPDR